MGTGAVGAFVGGRLQAAGARVHFVGRQRVLDALRAHGLRLTDLDGGRVTLPPSSLSLARQPPAVAGALVLLCVKSGATAATAAALAEVMPAGTPILSLQNGVGNVPVAAAAAPSLRWLRGMVPFNIAELASGHWHRGTSGRLAAEAHPALQPWLPLFERAGLPLDCVPDLRPLQWGKLLLNLNNPVNALSGLPLRAQLLDRDCRRVTAALQAEALDLIQRAGLPLARLTPVPPRAMPFVLRLPTPLFRLVAARSLRLDEKARSSMADDLALGRPTEIDALCGEVVRLARSLGREAPLNQQMVELLSVPAPQPIGGRALRAALEI